MRQLHNATALGTILTMLSVEAWAQNQQAIDVPAQPLLEAIYELSAETETPILVRRDLLAGAKSAPVTGPMSPRQALQKMIEGTDLSVNEMPDASLVISTLNLTTQDTSDIPFDLGTLILEGTLIDTPIQDNQDSVIVVTGEELEQHGDQDLYDVAERTPGITGSSQQRGFAVRGVDQRGLGQSNTGLAVSTQVDGATMTNFSSFDGPYSTWDLEQVEIYRGPQGTQQGRAAQAGSIIIRSADPAFVPEYRLRTEIGNFDTFAGAFVLNTPLVEDRLAFRLSGETRQTDGYVFNGTRNEDDFNAVSMDTLRAKLRWDPTPDITTVLSFSYTEAERGGQELDADSYPDRFISFTDVDEVEVSTHRIFGFRADWDINSSLRLESETTYYSFDRLRRNDASINLPDPDDSLFDNANEDTVFEQDLRLVYSAPGIDAVGGLFYTDISTQNFILEQRRFPGGVLGRQVQNRDAEVENFAVFGEATIEADWALPGLSFVIGARYDRETVRNIENTFTDADVDDPNNPTSFAESDIETTYDAFLPKLGVIYNWTDNISTGLTYQRSYRPGASQINPVGGPGDTPVVNEVGPEYADTLELAFRSQFFDNRLTFNANIFQTDYTDLQIRRFNDFDNNSADQDLLNAGEARARGVEFQIEGTPTEALFLYGSVAYLDTEFLDFVDGSSNRSGDEFTEAPRLSALIGFDYFLTDTLTLGADVSYRDEAFVTAPNEPSALSEERFLVNARLTYQDGPIAAGLYIRNLLDETYQLNSRRTIVGEPRTIGAFLEHSF